MTVRAPAFFLSDASVQHDAEGFRRYMALLTSGGSGVYEKTGMAVTQRAAGANMSVDVAGGRAVITGSEATYQGSYFVENRAAQNVVITAADPTNPRRDLIVAKVQDASYSGATNAWSLVAVAGTPAASPADPTAPANSISLARVAVAAGATSITNANLTDFRTRLYRGQPTGLMAQSQYTSTSGSVSSTALAIPGFSIVVTTPTGRYVRVSATVTTLQSTAISMQRVYVREGATSLITGFHSGIPINGYTTRTLSQILTPTAASHTYEVYLSTDAGTATVEGGTGTCSIWAEDVGEV